MLKFLKNLLDYIFCQKCYICKDSEANTLLCTKCFSKIKKNNYHQFENEITGIKFYSSGVYKDEMKILIKGLKFHNQKDLAKYIAKFMYDYWQNLNIENNNYVVVAVPQYIKTDKPYNHAQEIANEFAKMCGYVCDFNLVKRIKKTKPQYKLNYKERMENLEGAFELNKPVDNNATYIIIDDIITTSSTVQQMIKTLNTDKYIVFCAAMSEVYGK